MNAREIAVASAALDDVFSDDIVVPATDGFPLAATLFPLRGKKRHAVLINSATAVPRKVYRGFAGYLARRGSAVLTYDYRGTGDPQAEGGDRPQQAEIAGRVQRPRWPTGQPRSTPPPRCAGCARRYRDLPFSYVGHCSAARRSACCPTTPRSRARCWSRRRPRIEADGLARTLSRGRLHERHRPAAGAHARLCARLVRPRHGPAERRVRAVARLGDARALSARRSGTCRAREFSELQRQAACNHHDRRHLGDTARGRIAVLGLHLDHAWTSSRSAPPMSARRRSAISAFSAATTATRRGAAPRNGSRRRGRRELSCLRRPGEKASTHNRRIRLRMGSRPRRRAPPSTRGNGCWLSPDDDADDSRAIPRYNAPSLRTQSQSHRPARRSAGRHAPGTTSLVTEMPCSGVFDLSAGVDASDGMSV